MNKTALADSIATLIPSIFEVFVTSRISSIIFLVSFICSFICCDKV